MIKKTLALLKEQIALKKNKIEWKKRNKNNKTWIGSAKNINCITVGSMTWGEINTVDFYPSSVEECKINIGSYCSIASGVRFIRGGEHRIDRLSTYLFKSSFSLGEETNIKHSKDIIISDDVWIGMDCLILPGASVGQGAIIGAGSVVRGIVPPYSVYVGDKVVKYRFSEEVIKKLVRIDYSLLSFDEIRNNIDYFYCDVSEKLVDDLLKQQDDMLRGLNKDRD